MSDKIIHGETDQEVDPVFPQKWNQPGLGSQIHYIGLSVRDYAAMRFMAAMITQNGSQSASVQDFAHIAGQAYAAADEFNKAREK